MKMIAFAASLTLLSGCLTVPKSLLPALPETHDVVDERDPPGEPRPVAEVATDAEGGRMTVTRQATCVSRKVDVVTAHGRTVRRPVDGSETEAPCLREPAAAVEVGLLVGETGARSHVLLGLTDAAGRLEFRWSVLPDALRRPAGLADVLVVVGPAAEIKDDLAAGRRLGNKVAAELSLSTLAAGWTRRRLAGIDAEVGAALDASDSAKVARLLAEWRALEPASAGLAARQRQLDRDARRAAFEQALAQGGDDAALARATEALEAWARTDGDDPRLLAARQRLAELDRPRVAARQKAARAQAQALATRAAAAAKAGDGAAALDLIRQATELDGQNRALAARRVALEKRFAASMQALSEDATRRQVAADSARRKQAEDEARLDQTGTFRVERRLPEAAARDNLLPRLSYPAGCDIKLSSKRQGDPGCGDCALRLVNSAEVSCKDASFTIRKDETRVAVTCAGLSCRACLKLTDGVLAGTGAEGDASAASCQVAP